MVPFFECSFGYGEKLFEGSVSIKKTNQINQLLSSIVLEVKIVERLMIQGTQSSVYFFH